MDQSSHMSALNDPRVLFAAERTLMAWSRTAAGLMAFGFLIDRTTALLPGEPPRGNPGFWIGFAFVLFGVLLNGLAILQYRRAIATLRAADIPPGYWVNLSVYASAILGLLGVALALYLIAS